MFVLPELLGPQSSIRKTVALRVKPEQIGHGDELLLTATQIS